MKKILLLPVVLAGCMETSDGCPIYTTPAMQAYTQACQQAIFEEKARAAGQPVTKCVPGPGGSLSCTTG